MQIGIPKEIKNNEFRVGATPHTVKAFVQAGHKVEIQTKAGVKIGFTDKSYREAGARIVTTAKQIYQNEMIVKVKEPQPKEFSLLQEEQILFCYLHLAPDPEQTHHLLKQKVIGIAYETVTDSNGRLPLLLPMSEIAGRIAVQAGATALQIVHGGKGVLLGGTPGVPKGRVTILGGGIVGTESMRMALGLNAQVSIFDRSLKRLKELDQFYAPALQTLYSTPATVEESLAQADLVIGAVLIPGKTAPKLIPHDLLRIMQPGSVIVDVAIDQGGCCETSRPTTHSNPTYIVDDVVHYCVTNMPAACARTATQALTNATLPFVLQIANLGYNQAFLQDPHLMQGLNVFMGKVTNHYVALDLGYEHYPPEKVLMS